MSRRQYHLSLVNLAACLQRSNTTSATRLGKCRLSWPTILCPQFKQFARARLTARMRLFWPTTITPSGRAQHFVNEPLLAGDPVAQMQLRTACASCASNSKPAPIPRWQRLARDLAAERQDTQ